MKKIIFSTALILVLLGAYPTFSQVKSHFSLLDRLRFGGGFNLALGSITAIEVSPIVAYKITDKWLGGVGLSYGYYKNRNDFTTDIIGGIAFIRYYAFKNGFLQGQYESLNVRLDENRSKVNYNTFLIGGGFSYPIGNRSEINIIILYDLNHDSPNSPYSDPIRISGGLFF